MQIEYLFIRSIYLTYLLINLFDYSHPFSPFHPPHSRFLLLQPSSLHTFSSFHLTLTPPSPSFISPHPHFLFRYLSSLPLLLLGERTIVLPGLDLRCFFLSEERDELYHCIDSRCEDMLFNGNNYILSYFFFVSLFFSFFFCVLSFTFTPTHSQTHTPSLSLSLTQSHTLIHTFFFSFSQDYSRKSLNFSLTTILLPLRWSTRR